MNISEINPEDFKGRTLTQEKILEWFEECKAYWVYNGEPTPEKPHAELSSGFCSNGFFKTDEVLKYPNLNEILAYQLARKITFEIKIGKGDWVIGSPYGAITFSYEVSKFLEAIHGFAEKDPDNSKKMIWKRLTILKGVQVLRIEDVITTSGSIVKVGRAIKEGNKVPVDIISTVGTLIHRPEKLPIDYNEIKVIALVEKAIQNFKPNECPYCAVGSPRYRPKTNWRKLTGNG